jgi:hypothetical protein
MHQFHPHVLVDEDRDLSGIAIAGKIHREQVERCDQLARAIEFVFAANDIQLLVDLFPDALRFGPDVADER